MKKNHYPHSVTMFQFLTPLLCFLLIPVYSLAPKNTDRNNTEDCTFILPTNLINSESDSSPSVKWNTSNYKNYTQIQLLNFAVTDIKEQICTNVPPNVTALKNTLISNTSWNSVTFCDEFQSREVNITRNPSELIQFLIKKWRNKTDCEFACFMNLNQNVFPHCRFILQFYTGNTTTQSSKESNKTQEHPLHDTSNGNNVVTDNGAKSSNGMNNIISEKQNVSNIVNSSRYEQDAFKKAENDAASIKKKTNEIANTSVDPFGFHTVHQQSNNTEESHFFIYFLSMFGICIFFYFLMYNKKKILALAIEGRRKNVKRRPNTAAYSKLDCNLEEAMASGPSTATSATLLY